MKLLAYRTDYRDYQDALENGGGIYETAFELDELKLLEDRNIDGAESILSTLQLAEEASGYPLKYCIQTSQGVKLLVDIIGRITLKPAVVVESDGSIVELKYAHKERCLQTIFTELCEEFGVTPDEEHLVDGVIELEDVTIRMINKRV